MGKAVERDLAWVEARVSVAESGCWEWALTRELPPLLPYGRVYFGKRYKFAHRVVWEIVNGDIPDGMCVCHKCDNPPCVNPDHLFLGTNIDNIADRTAKGRDARGQKNGQHTHPERTARGLRHGSHTHPERRPRGLSHGMAKLNYELAAAMRSDRAAGLLIRQLMEKYAVSEPTVKSVIYYHAWELPQQDTEPVKGEK